MISFDVVSLFTKVPIDDALEALLANDDTLEECTSIPADEIRNLIELCLRTTYFRFGDVFYEQVDGAAMGSPLSPIVANLYMEAFESRALTSVPARPSLWVRFVDDTFVLWPHDLDTLEKFHSHLNQIHPSIQFTKEMESENQLNFLDVLVRRQDHRYRTSVYRKATHTDLYTHYTSHHHPSVKTGTIKCLKRRAEKICEDTERVKELQHLERVFQSNGYPSRVFQRTSSREQRDEEDGESEEDENEKPKILYLPYVKGVSEVIQRVCRGVGVKAVFKSHGTLREMLMKVKTSIPEEKRTGIVYQIPCQDCESTYIGETGRTLKKRMTEHKAAVRRGDDNNGIAVHAWEQQHHVDWDGAKIVEQEQHYTKRRVLGRGYLDTQDQEQLQPGLWFIAKIRFGLHF